MAVVLSPTGPRALPVPARRLGARRSDGTGGALPSRLVVPLRPVDPAPPAPAPIDAAQRILWHSRFGPVLIEVIDGVCFVNHEPVEPASSAPKG